MEQNKDYFDNRSEAEKLRNVASLVNDIVNTKPEASLEVQESEGNETEEKLPEVDPVVELVGKTISTHRPNRGAFFQGVQKDGNPKL
tara:strand:+ start:403 stop:663 length:261 start_codon:yes stop_codon:yes gene_type:complete